MARSQSKLTFGSLPLAVKEGRGADLQVPHPAGRVRERDAACGRPHDDQMGRGALLGQTGMRQQSETTFQSGLCLSTMRGVGKPSYFRPG